MKKMKRILSSLMASAMVFGTLGAVSAADGDKFTVAPADENGIVYITNNGGPAIAYSAVHGENLYVVADGYAFRDSNNNDRLDAWEDWRKTTDERAEALAQQMVDDGEEGIAAIAGLMLYSSHQAIPGGAIYTGGDYYEDENGNITDDYNNWDLSVGQKKFLEEDDLRHILITSVSSTEDAAKWSNNVQSYIEKLVTEEKDSYGIPANNSSDPRHGADNTKEFNLGAGGDISQWPDSFGMAATFDPAIEQQFAEIASAEYRALGIATALSPQVDIATDPRWFRMSGTFGEDSQLGIDMSKAYVDGFQTTPGAKGGWGSESVNAMVKHWPGGGSGEGGRDAHYGFGKFAVYPGNNFAEHLLPFTQGAFKLDGGTGKASAVMPYYTISLNQDTKYNENVGNGYSRYMISDLLRGTYKYDGVVCTDWGIVSDYVGDNTFGSTPWGVEHLTAVQKFRKVIEAGTDQFGGVNSSVNIIAAYNDMCADPGYGKSMANARFKESARRLLTNIFNPGLFENPYLDVAASKKIVGNSDFMEAGFNAQVKSIVMLKNEGGAIAKATAEKKKVYVPKMFTGDTTSWWGQVVPGEWIDPVDADLLSKYYDVVDDPAKADMAIVYMTQPITGNGYNSEEAEAGTGNGYYPISLQYREYTANAARAQSIGASPGTHNVDGTITDTVKNRSYKGKTVKATNEAQLDTLIETKEKMGSKPVVAAMTLSNPVVMAEIDPYADAIIINFQVTNQAALEVISGKAEPSGLLPTQMPANMDTVEAQYEDVAHDMECYKDSQGNVYDFAFGLNWSGVISDWRTDTYGKNNATGPDPDSSTPAPDKGGSPKTADNSTAPIAFVLIAAAGFVCIAGKKRRSRK